MRHVFVSDLHLSDGTLGSSVSEDNLINHLLLPIQNGSPARVVCLGDIFELLRSIAWQPGVLPWIGVNPGFQNFPKAVKSCVESITDGIIQRYQTFSMRLKDLVDKKQAETVYIPGNHDYMLRLTPAACRQVQGFLGLPHSSKPFPGMYHDASLGIYAVHGDQFDSINWHDRESGRWAFGDAVVLLLVNGFVASACDRLLQPKNSPDTPLAQALQDLDNVEPHTDLPLYFRYIMDRYLGNTADHDVLLASWNKAVDGLLALPHFKTREHTAVWALRKSLARGVEEPNARETGRHDGEFLGQASRR